MALVGGLGVGTSHTANAGDPYAARQIFINDNTNGSPEDSASPWGAGLGLETRFVISESTSFQVQLGVDYYQEVELSGHDTVYTPDGDHINPRDGYDYSDADDAVDQPSVEILAMMGLLVGF